MAKLPVNVLLAIAVAGCKPADEPPRRALEDVAVLATGPDLGGPPDPAVVAVVPDAANPIVPVVGEVARANDAGPASQPETESPDTEPEAVADTEPGTESLDTEPEIESPDTEPENAAPDSALPIVSPEATLAPELIAELARNPSADQKEQSRARNKAGLELHKKKDWAGARAEYEAALRAWPGHPFSRYNLACALALEGKLDEALGALRVLAHLAESQTTAADRLKAARVDSDFEALRADPRFRALTRATDIVVAWQRDADKPEARRVSDLLRTARWGSKAAPRAWNTAELPKSATILYRAEDPHAASVASEIAAAIDIEVTVQAAATLPPEAPPVVVWLGGGTATLDDPPPDRPDTPGPIDPQDPEVAPEGLTPRELKDFIGLRLHSGPAATRESLELKPTGFFGWEVRAADGQRMKRVGRYQVQGDKLVLTFKATTETPVEGAAPRVEVHENQTLTVTFSVPEPGVLAIDGKRFTTRPEP